MKQFFSRRSVAVLLAVIVVLSTVLLQTRFRFGKRIDAVTARFYSGSDSVASELGKLADASEILAGLAHLCDLDEAEEALNLIASMRELLRLESDDIAAIHKLYKDLLSEAFTLESLLKRQELNDTDSALLSAAQHDAA